jgi:hypothetical protein
MRTVIIRQSYAGASRGGSSARLAAAIVILVGGASSAWGQLTWSANGSSTLYTPAGVSVGIGTSTPLGFLNPNGSQPVLTWTDTNQASPAGVFEVLDTYDSLTFYRGVLGASASANLSLATTQATVNNLGLKALVEGGFSGANLTYFPSSGSSYINNGGNVGIGTTSPMSLLTLNGSAPILTLTDTNQASPAGVFQVIDTADSLTVYRGVLGVNAGAYLSVSNTQATVNNFGVKALSAGLFSGANLTYFPSSGPSYINNGANVGIGTTNPQNTLSVNGIVQAKEVLVNTGWSDYVFAPGYRLRPLTEVASYIQENHHLPGIPSEAEVEEEGVSLGEMQAKLLAKIEELTLHMIQADERIVAADERNGRLEQQNSDLQARIARLEKPPMEK